MSETADKKRDRILLVTGASSDIGSALIRRTAHEYQYIWAHYGRTSKVISRLIDEFGKKIIPIQSDFSVFDDTVRMAETIRNSGKIPCHIVHLAASKTHNERFHRCRWEDYQNMMDISLRSIVILLEKLIPYMSKQRYGKIVFMLTSYLAGVPPKYQSPYITVKYALYGLMRNLAAEYAAKGVMVNGVSPEMTETRFLDEIDDYIKQANAEKSPLKRNLMVKDVLPAIEYLLSSGADVVTGQNIGVTGGVNFRS